MNQVTAAGLVQLLDEVASYEFLFEEPTNAILLPKMIKIIQLILSYQGEVKENYII